MTSFTAAACRSAAEHWAVSGNPVHERFAPVLESWAVRFEAKAESARLAEQPDLFATNPEGGEETPQPGISISDPQAGLGGQAAKVLGSAGRPR